MVWRDFSDSLHFGPGVLMGKSYAAILASRSHRPSIIFPGILNPRRLRSRSSWRVWKGKRPRRGTHAEG